MKYLISILVFGLSVNLANAEEAKGLNNSEDVEVASSKSEYFLQILGVKRSGAKIVYWKKGPSGQNIQICLDPDTYLQVSCN